MSGAASCAVCSAPAANKCSACKQVAYCTKEHQKEHWKTHKDLCRPFEIKSSAELGRFLVASRDLVPGDVIMCEAALVVGPKLHSHYDQLRPAQQAMCLACYRPARVDSEHRCSKCWWPACGPQCPGNLKTHAAECAVLSLDPQQVRRNVAGMDSYHYDAITPLRCLLLQRRNPRKWLQILEMKAHTEDRGPGTDAYREVRDHVVNFLRDNYLTKLCGLVATTGEAVLPDTSDKTLHRLCGILDVNALEIRLPFNTEVVALYPTVCLLEHSCVPNTRHSFELAPGDRQYRITVTASTNIKRGDHISTMYTHALWGTQARRDHLKATKYFNCRCRRCSDPSELGTHISAMKCLGAQIMSDVADDGDDDPCGGTQLPVSPLDDDSDWRCDRCPVTLTSVQVSDLVTRIGDDVDSVLQGSPTVNDLEELLSKLSSFLHPHHYHCFAVKHSLVQLYGYQHGYLPNQLSDQMLQRKEDMCRELLLVTETLDPSASRLALYTSVLQYELQSAIMQRTRKQALEEPPSVTPEDVNKRAQESRALLQRAVAILQPEPQISAGSKMADLVTKSLLELESWMRGKDLPV